MLRETWRGSQRRRPVARSRVGCVGLLALVSLGSACDEVSTLAVGVESMTPEALRQLSGGSPPPLVVDLRDRPAFEQGHIPDALSLSVDELNGYMHRARLAEGRLVATICYAGRLSVVGAAVVASHGHERVVHVRGGMERWAALGYPVEKGPGGGITPSLLQTPRMETTFVEQLASFTAGMVVKPAYMLLGLVVFLALRRQRDRALTLIRRGMAVFVLGEAACAVNFYLGNVSDAVEMLHDVGMVAMGALLPWGLFLLLDQRVLGFSSPEARCVVQRFCGHCWKREPSSCGLQRMFLFLAPALAVISLIPLSVPLRPRHVLLPVFGTDVPFVTSLPLMVEAFRVLPLLAAALFLLTTVLLAGGKAWIERAQGPFFWGLGAMSFAVLRFFLFRAFVHMPVWSDLWEELTELVAVGAVALLLWVFRRQLGLVAREGVSASSAG